MTHDHAVRVVVSLVPEIEKRGAASVLTDYAEREDLPPAQLEKLGQVFNTLRTVSHIDNADPAERGATVSLLDVPELVVGYASGIGKEKAARAPQSFASHDPAQVDLNKALLREMRPAAKPIEKAAAVTEKWKPSVEDVADALLDLELEYRMDMSKHAGQVLAAAPSASTWERDISEFEKEALYLQPEHLVKAAGDFMETFAGPHHIRLERHDYSTGLSKRAFDVSSVSGETFAELAKAVGAYQVIVKMANGQISQQEFEAAGGDADTAEGLASTTSLLGGSDPDAANLPQPEPGAIAGVAEEAGARAGSPAAGGGGAGGLPPESHDREADRDRDRDLDRDSKPSKPKENGDKKQQGTKPGVGGQIAALLGAPIKATSNAVTGAAAKADETLTRITSKERDNKEQRKADIDVADVRRAINLRRMIGTDPVLREADPRDVLEIYNSIAELNPELAGNMPALRLILREAVSYEGITLDSQKLLTDIGKNRAQGEQASAENDKRRYASGGANPLNLLPKA